jgi:TIR domain
MRALARRAVLQTISSLKQYSLGLSVEQTAFISYSNSDAAFALKLANDLKSAGASVWLDKLDLIAGEPWNLAVEQALKRCPRMLVILSRASVQRENVLNEVSFALDKQKTVVPILYQECEVPFRGDCAMWTSAGSMGSG